MNHTLEHTRKNKETVYNKHYITIIITRKYIKRNEKHNAEEVKNLRNSERYCIN